jgi:hypothetical protein
MTAMERKLAGRLEALERQMLELQERAGMNVEALDAMRRDEAIEHMARTGDPEMIKEYIRNRRRTVCSPEFMTVVQKGEPHGQ